MQLFTATSVKNKSEFLSILLQQKLALVIRHQVHTIGCIVFVMIMIVVLKFLLLSFPNVGIGLLQVITLVLAGNTYMTHVIN